MACMLVLWITIPLLCLGISAVPLLAYFMFSHRLRGNIAHPFLEGILISLACWGAFSLYLIHKSRAAETFAAEGIIIACFFGFMISGALSALFYLRKKNRISLFPDRTAAAITGTK